jgi:hypothetical protein
MRNVSLMTHSGENDERSEEEEEEEQDIEEEESKDEVNGLARVDLAIQTCLVDSPSPSRFRGQ